MHFTIDETEGEKKGGKNEEERKERRERKTGTHDKVECYSKAEEDSCPSDPLSGEETGRGRGRERGKKKECTAR